ncbi:MAG: hypothetical protein IPP48_16450 [Chitinophagaceae bacterium]|nr:hypothetical protein [Chitinophagaceae bacterium]
MKQSKTPFIVTFKLNVILSLLVLSMQLSYSQNNNQIVFEHYGLEAGFNSREAMDITTTPNGMVWVTSNDGLVRYDGNRFKFYQSNPYDTSSLIYNYCQDIDTDKRGWLWVESGSNLELFKPQTEQFFHLKLTGSNNERKPVLPTNFYYDTTTDIMWITTRRGLYFSKGGSFNLQSISVISKDKLLADVDLYSVMPDGPHHLWLSGRYEVCKLNVQTGEAIWYKVAAKITKGGYTKAVGNIMCSYLDEDKILWLGTWQTGLIEFNTVTQETNQYFYRNPEQEENVVMDIVKIKEQPNTLWLSTSGFGFTKFNIKTKQFTSFNSTFYNDKYKIKGNSFGLFFDKNHIMWIGSETGLHKYDVNKQLFTTLDLSAVSNGVMMFPASTMALQNSLPKQDELLWFHIPYKGGYRYNILQQKLYRCRKRLLNISTLQPVFWVFL